MEQNEITVVADVKMDLKERRNDFHQFRNWTKISVRIEAIKCCPCYIKVTLIRTNNTLNNHEDNYLNGHQNEVSNLVVNINLPGLTIDVATSRTKRHTYGLFWKNNRKRCCIYLAFESQSRCDQHMKWLKKSIKNLELYRREILETRQFIDTEANTAAATLIAGGSKDICNGGGGVDSFFPLEKTTDMIRDIKDILGPLPDVPDLNTNWSRRISGVSGIYEEIMEHPKTPGGGSSNCADDDTVQKSNNRHLSRTSIVSGIYEIMKPPLEAITELDPPPLPPRTRINTVSEAGDFHRSYTNPETESFKKRTCNIFDFLRPKRTDSTNNAGSSCGGGVGVSGEPSSHRKKSDDSHFGTCGNSGRRKIKEKQKIKSYPLMSNKRNSFSSPDLSKINFNDNNWNVGGGDDVIDDKFNGIINPSSPITDSYYDDLLSDKNISQNILPSFNISCNLSTVNLVGSNVGSLNAIKSETTTATTPTAKTFIDDPSGYCLMIPIISINNDQIKENKVEIPCGNVPIPITPTSTITSNHKAKEDVIYSNILPKTEKTLNESNKNVIDTFSPPSQHINNKSNDEKYPSYFPNKSSPSPPPPHEIPNNHDDCSFIINKSNLKVSSTMLVRSHHHRTPRTENLYISTPHSKITRKTPPTISNDTNGTVQLLSNNVQNVKKTKINFDLSPNKNQSKINVNDELDDDENIQNIENEEYTIYNNPIPDSPVSIRNISILINDNDVDSYNVGGLGGLGGGDDNQFGKIVETTEDLQQHQKQQQQNHHHIQTPIGLYRKYATLSSRMSPNRYTASKTKPIIATSTSIPITPTINTTTTNHIETTVPSNKKCSDFGQNIKRFASMPRLRNLSPFKARVNRHNSDNF